ncbi:MAG: phosphotransferase [Gammaproteobacteria bacterium]|nr:phosphotransferase [Gammaproteobacteria bacterium]
MNESKEKRLADLTVWAAEQLQQPTSPLACVSGDASFRRYFRVFSEREQANVIVVDSPPDKEPIAPFLAISELFAQAKVQVPTIIAADEARGFMLLSDFGDKLFLPELQAGHADSLYRSALQSLVLLQSRLDAQAVALPLYDAKRLNDEMALFHEWFLEVHLGIALTASDWEVLDQLYQTLTAAVSSQLPVVVHRDFHSRNLMVLEDTTAPGIIDYQDAVVGPYTYDPVSLLKDCYIHWPRAQQLTWLADYRQQAITAGLALPAWEQVIQDYDLMGLQRHLKVAGIFCRLNYRDNKPGYLNDVPLTLAYLTEALQQLPQLEFAQQWWQQRLQPILQQRQLSIALT